MKPKTVAIVSAALLVSACASNSDAVQYCSATIDWTLEEGLCDPETAVYLPEHNAWVVSNICTYKANGKGYLSVVSADGRMLIERWAENMNAPAGMARYADQLYVVDYTRLHIVDLSGHQLKPQASVTTLSLDPPPGALNDIAISADGDIYVSDSAHNQVLRVNPDDGATQPLAGEYYRANGLHLQDSILYIGADQLWRYDLNSEQVTLADPRAPGDIDGIEADGQGGWVLSPVGGSVWHLPENGNPTVWQDDTISSTNIGYNPKARQVIVPTGFSQQLIAFTLQDGPCSE